MNTMQQARDVIELGLAKAQHIIDAHIQELGAGCRAGDGDHGTTMARGLRAANRALAELEGDPLPAWPPSPRPPCRRRGRRFARFGLLLMTAGQKLGAALDAAAVHRAGGRRRFVGKMGKAKVGDKTMLDVGPLCRRLLLPLMA